MIIIGTSPPVISGIARTTGGDVLEFTAFTVTDVATGLPATVYSDPDLTTVLSSLVTDNQGKYFFYALNGTYQVTISDPKADNPPLVRVRGVGATISGGGGGGGGSGDVLAAGNNSFTGNNTYSGRSDLRGITFIKELLPDPRSAIYAGGAPQNGVDDDAPAIQALIDSFGNQTAARAGKLRLAKGNWTLKSPVTIRRRCVEIIGDGWAPSSPADGGFSTGTTIEYKPTGSDNRSMFIFQEAFGGGMRNLRLMGNKDSTKRPLAGIELNAPSSGVVQPNTGLTFDSIFFGRFSGHDNPADPITNLSASSYLTNGIVTTGINSQNDISILHKLWFFQCATGLNLANSQSVVHSADLLDFHYCATGIRTVGQLSAIHAYFAVCGLDLDISLARVVMTDYASEYSGKMAKFDPNAGGELYFKSPGYMQISLPLSGVGGLNTNGWIVEDNSPVRTVLSFEGMDFRENSDYHDAEVATTRPRAKFHISTNTNGTAVGKILRLVDVNYGVGGLRDPITEDRLDIDPGRGGNGLDSLTIEGTLYRPLDSGGQRKNVPFYNFLDWTRPTPNFNRNDRDISRSGVMAPADILSADPSSPYEGQQWIRSDLNELRWRKGGVTYKVAGTAVP